MTKEQLKSQIERYEKKGSSFALAVVVGLAGEFSLPFLPLLPSHVTQHIPLLAVTATSNFLVFAGVFFEWAAHRKQSKASNELLLMQERESDQLRAELAAANERTEKLRERNNLLESVNATILTKMAFRKIDIATKEKLTIPLLKARLPDGLKIKVAVLVPNDFDVICLADDVLKVLNQNQLPARMEYMPSWSTFQLGPPVGLYLLGKLETRTKNGLFFVQLFEAFRAGGIELHSSTLDVVPDGEAVIGVGLNPELTREVDKSVIDDLRGITALKSG